MTGDVLVDLGRSHVRVVVNERDERRDGGAGLSEPGGPAAAAALVAAAVRATGGDPSGARLAVGAPGVVTAPQRADEFARALLAELAVREVLVVSDSAAWQAGAFAGGDGAVLAVGTGSVVVARSGNRIERLDGLGLLLGDVGGGAWIGLHALRHAARTSDSPLHAAARIRFGSPTRWPDLLGRHDLAARLAAFVPDVVSLAEAGDPHAAAVLDAAADGLATTLSALPAELATCVVGGLAALLAPRLRQRSGRAWVEPLGDPVDGLRALLDDIGPFAAESHRLTPAMISAASPANRATGQDHRVVDPVARETDTLPTEGVAPDTDGLDIWPTDRLVARLVQGHAGAVPAVLAATAPLARAVDLVAGALRSDGRLVYVGAGTPGRLALQDAAELVPTYGLDPTRTVVLLAGGAAAGARAIENAEDDEAGAGQEIDAADIGPHDVVIGVSASGRTPFVRAALARARALGAATVGIGNVPGNPLGAEAEAGGGVAIDLDTGPEVVAGSTRLAAGTAQKIALNTVSTGALIRVGKTYGPFMVDVLATNAKLRRRSVRIVRDAAGVAEDVAVAALHDAGDSVPVALTMILAGVDADSSRHLLAEHGSVRDAVRAAVEGAAS